MRRKPRFYCDSCLKYVTGRQFRIHDPYGTSEICSRCWKKSRQAKYSIRKSQKERFYEQRRKNRIMRKVIIIAIIIAIAYFIWRYFILS